MNYKFFIISIFISTFVFSQEILQNKDVYFDNNRAFKVENDLPITGFVEFRDAKKIIILKEKYSDGNLIKKFQYYNVRKMDGKEVVSREIDYKDRKKINKTSYRSNGEKFEFQEYDENGKMKLFEFFKNGIVYERINYKNGKKDGKRICHDKDGIKLEYNYKDGKIVK